MLQKHEKHYKRKRIHEEHLLEYVNHINYSDRNKTIMKKYAQGESYGEIAREFGITPSRVNIIIASYIAKCVWYRNEHFPEDISLD